MVQVTVSTSSASVDSVSTRMVPPCFTIRPATATVFLETAQSLACSLSLQAMLNS